MMKKVVLCAFLGLILINGFAFGTDYYISTQADFDTYRDATFSPGDNILLERGKVFTGMLEPRGSGTPGNVITISAYGTGDMPVINNNGVFHSSQGNSICACIYLFNVEYWEVNNIECTNYSSASGSSNSLDMYGVYVRAEDTVDPYDHIYIEDCYIHHINVIPGDSIENADKKRGGIHVHGRDTGSGDAGWFNDVRIVNNYIEYIGGVGIGTDGDNVEDAHTFLGDSRPGAWTNLYIADNYIGYTGRNNMIIRDCDYAIVEYNTLAYSSRDSTGHSSYCYRTLGITFQYNEVYGNTGDSSDKDRGGFDADNMSKDTVIQYNYSHNNEWFCGIMKDENMNVTIRYNLSVNERHGAYYYGFEPDDEAYNIKIYNNTHYFKSSITPDILCNDRTPVHTTFNNNIFYCEGTGYMGLNAENGTDNTYDTNVYYNITPPTVEINPITTDPLFVSPGAEPYNVDMRNGRDVLAGYRLAAGSPAIDAGLTISDNGGHDFWGDAVPAGDTDIGANERTVIPPDPATIVSPANTATGISRTADINWNAGAGAASHEVYFGTDSTPDAGEFIGKQAPTTYDPGLLSSNTTYYWRIDEVNGAGTTAGPVWSFTTGTQITPIVIVSPATDIDISSATLHGEVTDTAGETPSVTLYYGQADAGESAGSWDHSVSLGTQSSTFSTSISGLAVGTTYYYRAYAENSTGSDWSDVSSFETASSKEIIFDAVSGGYNNDTTFSWQHDLGGGDDRVVVVGIGIEQSDVVISSVTFNGVAMTVADGSLQDNTTNLTVLYYMLDADLPPSAGTYDIVVTSDIGDSIGAGAISLENVKQAPPEAVEKLGLGRGNTYISKDITTLTDGAWIVDVVGSGTGALLTPDSPQELRYWYKPSSSAVAGSTRVVPTAGTVVNGWEADDDHRMSLSMAAFAPVEVAGPTPPTVVNAAATNITSNSARLNGEVTDNGGEDPTVMIYWGTSDGETTPGNWDDTELLGTQNSTFFEDISSLSPETTYYFRTYAYNSAGGDWADSTASFATTPNNPPVWTSDPTDKADAIEDKPYVGSLSGDATDPDVGDVLEYSYVSGPAWLSIAANGDLTGTPAQTDVGGNSWIVSVTDGLSTPVEATVNITVLEIYDGENGLEDFARLSSLWLQTACGYCQGSDLNYDGDVGIDDLRIMAERWLSAP